MDLEELRVLLAVAESGSVLGASARLKVTRTTLRRRLESLEARVGAPLVFRGPSGAALTEAGEVVARHARTILDESAALLASARETGATAGGLLRVLLPVGLPPHALVLLHSALRAAHPRLSVEARYAEDPVGTTLTEVDLVFHFGDRLATGPWITRVVHPMTERLLASPGYLAARGTPRTPADLDGHDLLVWRRPGADARALPTLDGGAMPIAPTVVATDVHLLHTLAAAGSGLAFVPDGRIPDPTLPPDALVPVLPDHVGRDCPLRMVVPQPLARAPKVRTVLEQLARFLGAG
ncbi:MAG: LysR family transcriptional regulator [Pseudomonadota bacterium]|nr:LysR family transcriptional regulator [Pseudomonadota bacterium]